MTVYNDVPHGGKHIMTSSGAVPGKDITSETAQTTGTDVPEDQQHLLQWVIQLPVLYLLLQ